MKLLMITQKVDMDDSVLGFTHSWIEKLAGNLDLLYVICNEKGAYDLPDNVKVYSLGKEKGALKIEKFFRLQYTLFKILPHVDGVFVHMSPIYAIAGAALFKIFRKKVIMWYVHVRRINPQLRIVSNLVGKIITAVPESVPFSNKVIIAGHGIDVDRFRPPQTEDTRNSKTILFLGRLAPVKNINILINAFFELHKEFPALHLNIVGGAEAQEEIEYADILKKQVKELGIEEYVLFHGAVPNHRVPVFFQETDIFVNLTKTGGFDKAILEAMACGALPLISSRSYRRIFSKELQKHLLFREDDANDLAERLRGLVVLDQKTGEHMRNEVRDIVVKHHNLNNLAKRIINELQ